MNTNPRAGSADIGAHAFAAPALDPSAIGSSGSKVQRAFPLRTSYARTTPRP